MLSPQTRRDTGGKARDVPLSAQTQYFREARRIPRLDAVEELRLLHIVATAPADDASSIARLQARNRLVEGYQPLIIQIAQRFATVACDMPLLDLIQDGNEAVLRALDSYGDDPPHAGYGAWVYPFIEAAIRLATYERMTGLRVPFYRAKQLRALAAAQGRLLLSLQREPTDAELAVELKLSVHGVRELLAFQSCLVDSPLPPSVDTASGSLPVDAATSINLPAELSERSATVGISSRLLGAMTSLTTREQEFIRLRFGFDDGYVRSQQEMARELGTTLATVERMYRRIIRALRYALEPEMASSVA